MPRRKAKLLPGYKRLPGSARRYRTPDGKTISRRQYENRKARATGYSSWSELQRIRSGKSKKLRKAQGEDATKTYDRWLARAKETTGLDQWALQDPDSEFNRLLAKAADDDFDLKAQGAFHDFLVYLGYRDDSADIPPYPSV